MSGFIKLNRKFFEHSFWIEERTLSLAEAWLDLIQSARFEVATEKVVVKMKVITINRGELRASQRYLSKRWKWSIGKVNRFIKLLESERMIERRNEHGETVIKLCKYDGYNDSKSKGVNTDGNDNENSNGTPTDHQEIQTKESKEGEERKEDKKDKVDYKNRLLSELDNSDFDDPTYFEITKAFQELFKKNLRDAGCSTKNVEKAKGKWVDSIRLLIETDGNEMDSVRTVFAYLQKSEFWKTNILSTPKLRDQFDKLLMQAKNQTNGFSKKREPATSERELIEVLSKHFD